MQLDTGLRLAANLSMVILVMAGAVTNGWMLVKTIKRRILIRDSGQNGKAKISTKRAVRNEASYFICQLCMLVVSTWSVFRVLPNTPNEAIPFYYATFVARAIVSITLMCSSLLDQRDRKALRAYMQEQEIH